MLYTELTKKAMQICFTAHKDQVDKGGMPYIFHPMHLAEQMTDEASVCTALLHDVIEDTDTTIDDLAAAGFPQEVLRAVELVTHGQEETYWHYIRDIKANPIARAVKLADLRHNSDLSRLSRVDETALARVEKYRQAIEMLSEE
ncbi:MAG: HD domain-containing protein [Firmicutes bacterium]|nr:HD domain-containing protein [Bacillota bacterium]